MSKNDSTFALWQLNLDFFLGLSLSLRSAKIHRCQAISGTWVRKLVLIEELSISA
jgi:hypothetical protein